MNLTKGNYPGQTNRQNELQTPTQKQEEKTDYQNVVGQDSIDRFSKQNRKVEVRDETKIGDNKI